MNPEKEQEYVDPEADTEEPNHGEADEDAGDEEDEPEEGEDDEVALADVLPIMQQMCEYMGELVEAVRALSKPATEPPPKSKPKPKKKKAKPPSKWGYK